MADRERTLPLLNVFEVHDSADNRRLLCFLDPILAGSQGIDPRSVLGDFIPGPDNGFNRASFRLNPVFVETFTHYMNEVASQTAEIRDEARQNPSGWIYILDPRSGPSSAEEPNPSDLIGCFAVDDSGQVVPKSFLYNEKHEWFEPDSGLSGLLSDRKFYDWLHPRPTA